MEKVMMYDGRPYTIIFYDELDYVLTVNDEDGWTIAANREQLFGVPKEVYDRYLGKKGWWFKSRDIKKDFKPTSVENV